MDVPLTLARRCDPVPCTHATFYVLQNPGYHFILGLTLLNAIDGIVRCRLQKLTYTKPDNTEATVQLVTRSYAYA